MKWKKSKKYRLLNNKKYQDIVTVKLREYYLKKGLINNKTKIKYALAAGNIISKDEKKIKEYFKQKDWILFTPDKIKDKIRLLSEKGWEDNIITITAKLTMRE